jgi:hypothetical protein
MINVNNTPHFNISVLSHYNHCTISTAAVSCTHTHMCSCQQSSSGSGAQCCLSESWVWNIVVVHPDHWWTWKASLPHLEQKVSVNLSLAFIYIYLLYVLLSSCEIFRNCVLVIQTRNSSSSSSSKHKRGVPWRTLATRRSLLFHWRLGINANNSESRFPLNIKISECAYVHSLGKWGDK